MYEGETNVEGIAYIRKQVNMDNLVEKEFLDVLEEEKEAITTKLNYW